MNKTINRRCFLRHTAVVSVAAVSLTHVRSLFATDGNAEHRVDILNLKFSIETLIVSPGDKIVWVNQDIIPHTATAKDQSWGTGLIKPGESAIIKVTRNMTKSYYCEYHPTMVAQLVIDA